VNQLHVILKILSSRITPIIIIFSPIRYSIIIIISFSFYTKFPYHRWHSHIFTTAPHKH